MFLVLCDRNPEVVFGWTQILGDYQGLSFGAGDLLRMQVDAVVSPANSFGFMDGGIDLAYRNFFGLSIQRRVQTLIEQRFAGEKPVGQAMIVPTGHAKISRLVVAPTMKTPQNIQGTENVYHAMKAALERAGAADPSIERLGIPGMGTGIGGMDPFESARQLLHALVQVLQQGLRE